MQEKTETFVELEEVEESNSRLNDCTEIAVNKPERVTDDLIDTHW